MSPLSSTANGVKPCKTVRLTKFINLYGCQIAEETKIGAFAEIQKNAMVGAGSGANLLPQPDDNRRAAGC